MSPVERCDECGFDGSDWTDDAAVDAISTLGDRWFEAVAQLSDEDATKRPIENTWSIGEYVDHVREVLFAMRFVLGVAAENPGTDLGDPPASEFSPEAKQVDLEVALRLLRDEAEQLVLAFRGLPRESWSAVVRFEGEDHDAHWICRHAVHDATHHLGDVERLKAAMTLSDRP